jgi:hypothetical protein
LYRIRPAPDSSLEKRKSATIIGNGFIGDANSTARHEILGLFRVGCEVQIREQNLPRAASSAYGEELPLLNSGLVSLLDNRRAIAQIASLERRTSRGGKDSIDHSPGGRAGAVHLVLARPKYEPQVEIGLPIVGGGGRVIDLTDEFPQVWRRTIGGVRSSVKGFVLP